MSIIRPVRMSQDHQKPVRRFKMLLFYLSESVLDDGNQLLSAVGGEV